MVLRGCDRRRQMIDAEFLQARQKTLLLLATKHTEDKLGRISRASPRDHSQNEAGEIGMIEIGDAAPFEP